MEMAFRSREASIMQFLHGLIKEANAAVTVLRDRLTDVGELEAMEAIADSLARIVDKLMATIPAEKRAAFNRNLSASEMRVQIKGPPTTDASDYTYVRAAALVQLCLQMAKLACTYCGATPQEMAHCAYRTTLKECLMIDFAPRGMGACEYSGLPWEG